MLKSITWLCSFCDQSSLSLSAREGSVLSSRSRSTSRPESHRPISGVLLKTGGKRAHAQKQSVQMTQRLAQRARGCGAGNSMDYAIWRIYYYSLTMILSHKYTVSQRPQTSPCDLVRSRGLDRDSDNLQIFNRLFLDPRHTSGSSFMKICSLLCKLSCGQTSKKQRSRQTNRETDK